LERSHPPLVNASYLFHFFGSPAAAIHYLTSLLSASVFFHHLLPFSLTIPVPPFHKEKGSVFLTSRFRELVQQFIPFFRPTPNPSVHPRASCCSPFFTDSLPPPFVRPFSSPLLYPYGTLYFSRKPPYPMVILLFFSLLSFAHTFCVLLRRFFSRPP